MEAEQILRRLGVSGKLKGFHYATYMVEQIAENPTAIFLITKRLYIETARHFHVSVGSVERDVRTLIQVFWKKEDREFLDVVAGRHLLQRPTNSEFLDMTAAFLRHHRKS